MSSITPHAIEIPMIVASKTNWFWIANMSYFRIKMAAINRKIMKVDMLRPTQKQQFSLEYSLISLQLRQTTSLFIVNLII